MMNRETKTKELPLTGKLITAEPASIGQNFRSLVNLGYTDTHLKAVRGMTKINTTAMATYIKTRSAFHFKKAQPAESHVLVQAYTTALTTSGVLENTAVIPGTAAFAATALWADSAGAGRGYFSEAPDGQVVYCNGVDACLWGGDELWLGALLTSTAAVTGGTPTSPKNFTDQMNNSRQDATNILSVAAGTRILLVGTVRPIKGIKAYVKTANATTSSMTGSVWTGSSWSALSITDNTAAGGITLAQTGTVTFATTVGTAKPLYMEGYYLYWYQFTVSDGTAEIYHVTVDAPFQAIVDMWDGVYRTVMRFFEYKTAYIEYTINVYQEDYETASTYTFYPIGSLPAYSAPNNFLEIGFAERQTGIRFSIPMPNTTASTTCTIEYWTGSAYATVGTMVDGTATGGVSLNQTGVISWNADAITDETTKVISNSPALYFYRVRFDKAISSGARIDYVGGITAQKPISNYKFPLFAQGRVLLCCDKSAEKNRALAASKYMPQVYNGYDSVNVYFGEEGELTCGTELFSQFGSSLYSLILMFKDYETWVVAGTDISYWENNTFLLSSSIGCPAPLTLKTINLAAEPGAGINRSLAIWQAANGVYMSDGRAPIPIHGDIGEYFDPADSRCIKASMVGDSVGFVDTTEQKYHLLIASGSSATTLNTELVYDIHRNRWFEIDRGADLQCGVTVRDTDGNGYNYGFLDTGYMERLEYGTTFDGTDITHTLHLGDLALEGLSLETLISEIRLFTVGKTTTANSVTLTHSRDTGTVSSAVAAQGTITMSGVPVTAETFTIDTQEFVWATSRTSTGTVGIGVDATACAANIITAMSADMTTVTAAVGTTAITVSVTAATVGVLGNAIVFTESCTNMAMDGSGVLGGSVAGADSTATTLTMSPTKTGYRVADPSVDEKLVGDPYHGLKFVMVTNNETIGFEPLAVVVNYRPI
jgi:hypothetical protein